MVDVVILGGGNIGDVKGRLQAAETLITERIGSIVSRSEWYTTEPWGFESSSNFTNRAWMVETALEAAEVLEILLAIEVELGRNRKAEYRAKVLGHQSYADRVIDLDILLYGQRVIVTPHLQIPHPRLLERDFAMFPMCDAMKISSDEGVELVRKIVEDEI
ncbi:MAG: 2-amino-4-hydroxy-6-hydroxymethyldihydropteridine diphosphokinase [Alistipes sp.]|nr:2-amino-4-hydroxy-6-hydroxymethyldihydropteridine diphosphokinase [Alistipes sp.]